MEKIVIIDQIELTESGAVQVRTATSIVENGVVIAKSYHRHVVKPGDNYSQEDARVQDICAVAHTSEVIESFKAATAAQGV